MNYIHLFSHEGETSVMICLSNFKAATKTNTLILVGIDTYFLKFQISILRLPLEAQFGANAEQKVKIKICICKNLYFDIHIVIFWKFNFNPPPPYSQIQFGDDKKKCKNWNQQLQTPIFYVLKFQLRTSSPPPHFGVEARKRAKIRIRRYNRHPNPNYYLFHFKVRFLSR